MNTERNMQMKSTAMMAAALLAAMVGLADTAKPKLTPEERAQRREQAMRRTGGIIEKKGEGRVVIVNCQSAVGPEAIEEALDGFRRVVHVEVQVEPGTFALSAVRLPKGANLALFVVDDPALPMSLVAMEERWGMMNVAPLKADAGRLAARFKKEFVRASSIALGGYVSQFKGSPLQPVAGIADLDAVVADGYTFDVLTGITKALAAFGVTATKRTTYKKACEEGWAPAPTNEFQHIVWEQVKADKERGPTNPITIPPPNKKK